MKVTRLAFSIRNATERDAEFVVELFALPHVRDVAHGPPTAAAFLRALDGDNRLLIIEYDGRPCGHAAFGVTDGWLMDVRVIAFAEQRTGAGRFTMAWLVRHAFEELFAHRIFLEVLASNAAARTLYEGLGFRREGSYRDGYRSGDGTFHDLIPYGLLATDV